MPLVGREEAGAEPPFVVVVHGPPGVGKSSVIRSLVKHFTKQNVADVQGPVTVVSGKQRRLTFVECPQDLNAMVDTAKVADLVLLVIDGSFGFEMETFEYLNMLQVHGFPKVIGVLTHLDTFTKVAQLRKAKKRLKARFWAEIYDGAKLFYFSGLVHGKYPKREVLNLSRFISVQKVRALRPRRPPPRPALRPPRCSPRRPVPRRSAGRARRGHLNRWTPCGTAWWSPAWRRGSPSWGPWGCWGWPSSTTTWPRGSGRTSPARSSRAG